jgi:hypothetical protein
MSHGKGEKLGKKVKKTNTGENFKKDRMDNSIKCYRSLKRK